MRRPFPDLITEHSPATAICVGGYLRPKGIFKILKSLLAMLKGEVVKERSRILFRSQLPLNRCPIGRGDQMILNSVTYESVGERRVGDPVGL
ncbi:hypothetical protein F4009_05320 [Candidatus Poribacteria bacterium]|nr:hypothetical protein [Candidatus Poribacteria bacterium]